MRPAKRERRDAGIVRVQERQVLLLVASGRTEAEIGALLDIGPRTVNWHKTRIKRRLGAFTMPHAIALAYEAGELPGTPKQGLDSV